MSKFTMTSIDSALATQVHKGLELGQAPTEKNTLKAIQAVATRKTSAADRALWSGYICQLQQSNAGVIP